MRIERVQNYDSNLNKNFTGSLVDNYPLRKFKGSLSAVDADIFEKYIGIIQSVDDGKKFVYKPELIGNNLFAKIYEVDKNGNLINPPRFVVHKKNPMALFKQLANWYVKRAKS